MQVAYDETKLSSNTSDMIQLHLSQLSDLQKNKVEKCFLFAGVNISHPSYWFMLGLHTSTKQPSLNCDHFDCGSDQSWCEQVDLAIVDFDVTPCQ